MKIVEFHDIHRSYRPGKDVLSGVDFSIEEGQVVGLLGPNGSGKTTLIHVAMGMLRAQRGTVRLFGLDPLREPLAVKRRVGFVSENQLLPIAMRVEEVIGLHRDLFPDWDREFEARLSARFGFDGRTKVRSLSKGQARQLALLCAVSHRPELLLLDEPAGGLDPAARREFLETAIQLLSESGTTILFSSHHMADVERVADRVVMLHEGRVLIDKPLDDLREHYSLAVLPANGRLDRDSLAGTAGCVRVRTHQGTLHAVFDARATAVQATLEERFGLDHAHCVHVPLEDLFVELVGGDS
ncbi:MAG: ABC transporter ATP-binding protein [Planctomycetota bacterium]|jgi:ABC-2 type transport system ATP-binding protein